MPSITIRGDTQLLRTFANINDFDDWATPAMERGIDGLFERVKTYPTQSATKTGYVRTFTLQRSIDKDVASSPRGVIGTVFSHGANQGYGDYESFVKVDGFQAEIHKGTWPTGKDDLEEEEDNIVNEFAIEAAKVLR